uniref:RING-type domain-containing protein n=1 Tax=Solanum lycopersicum TaxID=4081 RepID=K4AYN5_SOLLC
MDFQFEVLLAATTTDLLICGIKFRWFCRPDNHLPPPFTDEARYCAVCLYDVISGENCRKLPKCGHVFHVECVDAWLQSNRTCPLCRRQVTDQGRGETVISRAEDFILEKIYNPITEIVTVLVSGVNWMEEMFHFSILV